MYPVVGAQIVSKCKESQMVKVSIIVPVYNDQEFTKRCVDSIHRNTKPDEYELIIVDNGSNQITRDFLSTISGITYIRNENNEGFAKAINQGINSSSGNYVLLLNNDTILFPGWLPRMVGAFDQDTGAVGPLSNYVMGKQRIVIGRKEATPEQIHNIVSAQNKGRTTQSEFLIGFAVMISRAALNKVGLLDERFFAGGEDLDYSLRLRRAGFKLKIAEDVFVLHFGSVTSKNILKKSDEYFKQANQEFFTKWSTELGTEITSYRKAFEVALNLPGPNLTICTIVKNESGLLENMIKKTNAFCDDYIIVDTGTTDNSIDKIKALLINNGNVISYKWDNNFSKARNVGLCSCRGKWILQLDADEIIEGRHAALLRKMLEQNEVDAFRFKIINFREDPFLVAHPKHDIFTSIRMWKNNPEIRYEGMVHETATESMAKLGYRVIECSVPILHFAYLKSPSNNRFELMQKAAREEPQRSNNHYFLGEEYLRRGDFRAAVNCFVNALACNNVKRNDMLFATPVQQMLDITRAALENKDIETFPENTRTHFKFLIGL